MPQLRCCPALQRKCQPPSDSKSSLTEKHSCGPAGRRCLRELLLREWTASGRPSVLSRRERTRKGVGQEEGKRVTYTETPISGPPNGKIIAEALARSTVRERRKERKGQLLPLLIDSHNQESWMNWMNQCHRYQYGRAGSERYWVVFRELIMYSKFTSVPK